MPEYHPPLAGRDALRLDFNENTFAASPKVIERLRQVTAEGLTKYPEREGVERVTAEHFGLRANQVLLTNGVDEAIHLVCAAFLEEDDAPQAVVMADEAYYHFHGDTVLPDIAKVPNLVVARTFSKAYGLANLRIGMLAGSADLMKYVRKVSSPYNVNGVALDCLPVALADDAYVQWYAQQVNTGRERMMDGLRALGIEFFPSHANFVLMKIGPKHAALVKAMRARGVLLRDRSTDPGCDGYVRITIGIDEHVTRGLQALKESLAEIGWTSKESQPAQGRTAEGDRDFE